MQPQPITLATEPVRRMDSAASRMDELDDIVELLWDYAGKQNAETRELAMFIAQASMGDNHLWQDMGLPSRAALSALMQAHFPRLVEKNAGDMKWKKFFYKQLCERAEILICKSPTCAVCMDYDKCFGPET